MAAHANSSDGEKSLLLRIKKGRGWVGIADAVTLTGIAESQFLDLVYERKLPIKVDVRDLYDLLGMSHSSTSTTRNPTQRPAPAAGGGGQTKRAEASPQGHVSAGPRMTHVQMARLFGFSRSHFRILLTDTPDLEPTRDHYRLWTVSRARLFDWVAKRANIGPSDVSRGFISVKKFARATGLTEAEVCQAIEIGQISAFRWREHTGQHRIPKSEVNRWRREHP